MNIAKIESAAKILWLISNRPGLSTDILVEELGYKWKWTLTIIIELVDRGYVVREPRSNDPQGRYALKPSILTVAKLKLLEQNKEDEPTDLAAVYRAARGEDNKGSMKVIDVIG